MWKAAKLGDIYEFRQGIQVGKNLQKKILEKKTDVRFLRIIDFTQASEPPRYINFPGKKYLVNKNDVSLVRYGNPGFVCRGLQGAIANNLFKVIPKTSDICNEFLYWFLMSSLFQEKINIGKKGVAIQAISFGTIKDIKILFPPLAEQQHIVAKLDATIAEIDKAIDLDEQILLKIDLFKAAVLKNEFDSSSKKIKLKNLVVYDRQQGEGSNLPYVGMENISSETMQIIGDIIVPEKTSSTFKFNNTHVLFGRLRPYLKKVLIPNFKGQCSTEIFCLKPSEKINKLFLAYWLLSPSISHKINKSSTGARMPRANMNELLNYDFPDFSFSKQQQIVNRIDTAFTLIENFKKKLLKKISNFKSLKLSIISQKLKNKAA